MEPFFSELGNDPQAMRKTGVLSAVFWDKFPDTTILGQKTRFPGF